MKRLLRSAKNLPLSTKDGIARHKSRPQKAIQEDGDEAKPAYDKETGSEYDSDFEELETKASKSEMRDTQGDNIQLIQQYYSYNPLPDGRWIRLAKLLPGVGKDPIVVDLLHYEHDCAPP